MTQERSTLDHAPTPLRTALDRLEALLARLESLEEDAVLTLANLQALTQQMRDRLDTLTATDHHGLGRGGMRGSRVPY